MPPEEQRVSAEVGVEIEHLRAEWRRGRGTCHRNTHKREEPRLFKLKSLDAKKDTQ